MYIYVHVHAGCEECSLEETLQGSPETLHISAMQYTALSLENGEMFPGGYPKNQICIHTAIASKRL